jgi:colanic acid/amylovoran biosynthesis glycosyltransferase
VAYLVNQYPAVSHTFIRREIRQIEAEGVLVGRFTIRRSREGLVDDEDRREAEQTRVLLEAGPLALAGALFAAALGSPRRFSRALRGALRRSLRDPRRSLHQLGALAEAALLKQWLREGRFAHVHAHFATNSATVAMLCRELGGPPFSFVAHGIDAFEQAGQLEIREKLHSAAMAMAVSEHGAEALRRTSHSGDVGKIHLVRCILPDDLLDQDPEPPGPEPRLVFVGRLAEEKNPRVLVRAAADLIDDFPDLRLTIVGDGPLRGALASDIDALGVRDHVRLAGWCDGPAVREELRASRALVLCSRFEGLPTVILEAYALGRPVIATSVAAVPELVRPGTSGWLIEPDSFEPLVAAMREALLATPTRLAELASEGRRAVAADHRGSVVGRRLAELFRDSIARPVQADGRPTP